MNNFRFFRMNFGDICGSALIALIAAIAIFSVLAAALLSLTSTSGRQAAMSQIAGKAALLAESGYRYAVSRYQHPQIGENGSIGVLDHLDGHYTLNDNDGSFQLKIFSYFFILDQPAAKNSSSITIRTPGNFPDDEIDYTLFSDEKIRIGNDFYSVTSFSSSEDNTFLVGIDPGLSEDMAAMSIIHPAAKTIDSGEPWNSVNRSISFNSNQARMFPARNGQIRVAGRTLTYRLKQGTTFTDVRALDGTAISDFSIPTDTSITLLPYVRIASTGIYGADDAQVRREINYYGGLPASFNEVIEEKFDNETSILKATTDSDGDDTMTIGTVGGDTNQVFEVTSSNNSESHALLDVEGNAIARNAKNALNDFRNSTGGYLSYDVQTKVGFYSDSVFDSDIIESLDLAAGLSFRIRSEIFDDAILYNMYGLSFLNKETAVDLVDPTLLDSIMPPGLSLQEPAIVLWQQTLNNDGTANRTWLAYKKMVGTTFLDDFTSALNTEIWTDDYDNWQWNEEEDYIYISAHAPMIGEIHFQENLPVDEEKGYREYSLSIDHSGNETAIRRIRIYIAGETDPITVDFLNQFNSQTTTIPLPYAGREIVVDFLFQNIMGSGFWRIDNVKISGKNPIHNSTLIVRLKEAAVIPFNYNESETLTFSKEDRIFGASGAYGRLIIPPILNGSTDPMGYLLLNSVSTTWFEENEALTALGKGSIAQVYGAPSAETCRKANIIKVYYAAENGLDDPTPENNSPLDCYTKAYGRLSATDPFQWPVQEGTDWTSSRDYFQIIQWDEINTEEMLFSPLKDTYDGEYIDKTIIITHNTKLQSVEIDAANPELGLHAIGDMGASYVDHVYFDDFGFQLYQLPNALFPNAFQQ